MSSASGMGLLHLQQEMRNFGTATTDSNLFYRDASAMVPGLGSAV